MRVSLPATVAEWKHLVELLQVSPVLLYIGQQEFVLMSTAGYQEMATTLADALQAVDDMVVLRFMHASSGGKLTILGQTESDVEFDDDTQIAIG